MTRLRFSLLNLLLLLTTAAACFGLYAARQRNVVLVERAAQREASLQAEVYAAHAERDRIRIEAGALVVEDPEKYHAIYLEELRDNYWAYRVYLPPGRNYTLACKTNDLPKGDALPQGMVGKLNTTNSWRGGVAVGLPPGEYVVTYLLEEMPSGEWRYRFNVRNSQLSPDTPSEGKSSGSAIPDKGRWPYAPGAWSSQGGVTRKQHVRTVGEPLVLLNRRVADDLTQSSGDATDGVMIWVEEMK